MTDDRTTVALVKLEALRTALEQEPSSEPVQKALHQCERLQQAIPLSHAEGIRFASFTLTRLAEHAGTTWLEATTRAFQELKAALIAAGYPH